MRYSIIHHDVREHFLVTTSDYLVCDSIHQLSYYSTMNKSNLDIAEFLGVNEKTVRRAIISLTEKGLIERVGSGYKATPKWVDAVTFASGKKVDKMSTQSGQNAEKFGKMSKRSLYSNNSNNITSEIGISPVEDEVETTRELLDSEGNSLNPEKPQKRESRTKDKLAAFSLFSLKDAGWKYHPAQRAAALRLFDRGLEKVAAGLKVMREHEDDQTCPQASTPLEYEKKQPSLVRYVQRIGK